MGILTRLFVTRSKIGFMLSKSMLPKSFSIISEDCWAGQLYRQYGLQYKTPTVGLFIRSKNYLDYISNINEVHKHDFIFLESKDNYPVARLSNVEMHFMHYRDENHSKSKYKTRYERLDWENLFIKIDFGKPGYTKDDIERWNQLRLPNAVALYPVDLDLPKEGVYNGVSIADWNSDGALMFEISKKYFNIIKWVKTGKISNGPIDKLFYLLFLDPTIPGKIVQKIRSVQETFK